ncbi:hypothetical protein LTR08_001494 [Meristemomyces frigidus]|nr:hypothetical protein LTR08_001494 [Meristemomyces frigidus]
MSSSNRASADDLEDHVSSPASPVLSTKHNPPSSKPNAFTEMMGTKYTPPPLKPPPKLDPKTADTLRDSSWGLAAYTKDPASFPASRVVYFNKNFVVINDLFPKASVHLLILPRDTTKNKLHPHLAFDDPAFLADCRKEEQDVRAIVASELRRRFGQYSATDRPYLDALSSDDPPEGDFPPGRDWDKEVISGIHANPSMKHLHIHVLSRDMVSESMKKTNHYLSFTTDFFVGLENFPLAMDDHRRSYGRFPKGMKCWRCGTDYGNKMASLLKHLREEFEEWKRE